MRAPLTRARAWLARLREWARRLLVRLGLRKPDGPRPPKVGRWMEVFNFGRVHPLALLGSTGAPRSWITYRAARRALARKLGIDWRKLPLLGAEVGPHRGMTVVKNPMSALRPKAAA